MFEDNDRTTKNYNLTNHSMIHEIRLDRCLGWCILCKRLVYAENVASSTPIFSVINA